MNGAGAKGYAKGPPQTGLAKDVAEIAFPEAKWQCEEASACLAWRWGLRGNAPHGSQV